MTLIELLIVLGLLAGLAGMALTTVGDMGRRGRYDETTARLRLVREAVVGDGVAPGRFLRDMGRLPYRHSHEEGEELAELWRDEGNLGYGEFTGPVTAWPDAPLPAGVPEVVTLRGGWNGPYLAVNDPAGAKFFDGFGNAFAVAVDGSGFIQVVTSFGADGQAGGAGWAEADRSVDLAALLPQTSLRVEVKARDSANAWQPVEIGAGAEPFQVAVLRVGLFYPDISAGARNIGQDVVEDEPLTTFSGLAPTAVRLFAYSTGDDLVSGAQPQWVDLAPGANSVTLYLREAP